MNFFSKKCFLVSILNVYMGEVNIYPISTRMIFGITSKNSKMLFRSLNFENKSEGVHICISNIYVIDI